MPAESASPFRDLAVDDDFLLLLEPLGWSYGEAGQAAIEQGAALPFLGGTTAFSIVRVCARSPDGKVTERTGHAKALCTWLDDGGDPSGQARTSLNRLTTTRQRFAGLDSSGPDSPLLMGIINVTPDSFHADSRVTSVDQAYDRARRMLDEGADIIDIGGESTRPGAEPIPESEELDRILPVVDRLCAAGAVVSVDTRHESVMQAALSAGARIINDVSALTFDARSLETVASADCGVVLMHMQGDPSNMQRGPAYDHVVFEVYDYLRQRVSACLASGITHSRICVDPGIGFGKTARHSASLLRSLAAFHGLGCIVLVGASRKSFLANISLSEPPAGRLPGSIAAACAAAMSGAQIVRVHDVAETKQALRVLHAVGRS